MSTVKVLARAKRKKRVRGKISGTADIPRLNVFRSSGNIFVQMINDVDGKVIVAASTLDKELKGKFKSAGNIDAAKEVGKLIAAKAQKNGVKKAVFDRAGYLYHGRIKALADAAREAGLQF